MALYATNVLRAMHEIADEASRSCGTRVWVTRPAVERPSIASAPRAATCRDWRVEPVRVRSQLFWRLIDQMRSAWSPGADAVHVLNEGPLGPRPAPFVVAVHELPIVYARRVPRPGGSLLARAVRLLNEHGVLDLTRRAAAVLPLAPSTAADVIAGARLPQARARVATNGLARELYDDATELMHDDGPTLPKRYVQHFTSRDDRGIIDEAAERVDARTLGRLRERGVEFAAAG